MAIKKSNKKVNLRVDRSRNVILTATIGNAQIGASVVRFKGSSNVLAKGEIKKCNLGIGSSLVGKKLVVISNILDSNDLTNGVVVTYFFEACTPLVTTFNDRVDNDGDIFSYIVEFTFV